jgi:hypothetical protein
MAQKTIKINRRDLAMFLNYAALNYTDQAHKLVAAGYPTTLAGQYRENAQACSELVHALSVSDPVVIIRAE